MRFHRVVQVIACGMSLAAVAAPPLKAQQVAPRLRAPAPPDSQPATPQLAPLPHVVMGGVVGGVLIGGVAAGIGALVLEPEDDDFMRSEQVGAIFGFALGYPVGVALGTRYAAAPAGHRPSAGRMLLASAVTAGMGALVWNVTGRTADQRNPDGDNIDMWYVGATVGSLVHVGATSWVAWREARRMRRAPAAP